MSKAKDLNAPEHWQAWLKACQKSPGNPIEARASLGMLTGQDARALRAVAACWALYASSDDDGRTAALTAIRALLPGMQRQCWPFARELVAQSLDWHDRDRLWALVVPFTPGGYEPVVTAGDCMACNKPLPNDGRLFFCDECSEHAKAEAERVIPWNLRQQICEQCCERIGLQPRVMLADVLPIENCCMCGQPTSSGFYVPAREALNATVECNWCGGVHRPGECEGPRS